MDLFSELKPPVMMATVVYTLLGMGLCAGSFWVVTLVSPFSIRKEIEEDQNTALGVIIGAMFIGIAIVIAAAIH